jgi:hypothetical protein
VEVVVPPVPDGRYVFVGFSGETGEYVSEQFRVKTRAESG